MNGNSRTKSTDWLVDDWHSFIDRLPEITPLIDVACLLTPEHEFIHIDDETARAYGMNPEELIGQKCYEVIHDQDEPIEECPCPETLDTGVAAVGEVFEENNRYYLPATSPIYDDNGELQAIAHSVCDVTEQQKSLRANERHRELLAEIQQLAAVGGWELDFETETVQWTKGTRRIHEVSDEFEPTLDDALAFFHSKDQEKLEKAIETCRNHGAPFDLEVRLITAENNIRWVRTIGKRVDHSERRLLRGAIIDVTDHKHREKQRSVLNRILRHTVRNEMNVVKGNASLIHETAADDDVQDYAATIEESAEGLTEISEKATTVDTFFTRDSALDVTCDVGAIVSNLAAEFAEKYPDADLTVVSPDTVHVRADEHLKKAIREAVVNAVVHNDRKQPTVTITVTPPEEPKIDDFVEVEIADTGPGISEHEHPMVELGEETPLHHGTGLGLELIYWMVTAFGGELCIRENDPRGSVVMLRLPAASP